MPVQLNLNQNATAIETLDTNVDGLPSGGRDVTHSAFNVSKQLNAATTPSVSKVASDSIALVAGATTINFRALPLVGGGTLDANTLKPVSLLITNPSTNAGAITVAKGGSFGYTGFGANFSITIPPGGSVLVYTAKHSSISAVSDTNKNLDVAGTGTESFNYSVTFG